jgi:DNA repair protein RecO (recombination protein O)
MIETTKAIVLNSLKYGDSSLIVKCFTESCGLKSYMIKGILSSKKTKLKTAYFQPLMQLNITANHNNKGRLNSIRDVEILQYYTSLYTDVKKQAIVLFLSEIMHASIREEEKNKTLFQYLETGIQWLDTHGEIANFHLLFLLNFTKYLGFYPETNINQGNYFNLLEGKFTNKPGNHTLTGKNIIQFKRLLGINFDVLHNVEFGAADRQALLLILIQYFELHLSGFKKPKSLNVLKAVFS